MRSISNCKWLNNRCNVTLLTMSRVLMILQKSRSISCTCYYNAGCAAERLKIVSFNQHLNVRNSVEHVSK